MPLSRCLIALGSNVGDREHNLIGAARRLEAPPTIKSSIYKSSPVDCKEETNNFYNSIVEIVFEGSARDLLCHLQQIEHEMGRPPLEKREIHAPRTIDLDMLTFGETVIDEPDLVIPHPRMTQRRFVLEPLAEIRPDLVLPGREKSVAELLESLDSSEPPLKVVTREW